MSKHAASKSIAILACVFLLSGGFSYAQQTVFKNMFPNENFQWVTNITQDPKGNMWFISGSGLVSYNGYTSNYYKHDPRNANSLAGLRVECVYADKKGIIWVGFIGAGLDRFDPQNGSFTHYRHNPRDSTTLGHDMVTDLFEDKEGNFWVGTHGGLDKMDKKTGRFTHFVHKDNDPTTISNNQVRIIYQDKEGSLWIGTGSAWLGRDDNTFPGEQGIEGEGGLNKMDVKAGKFTQYLSDPKNPNTLINNKVRAIFEDNDGHFWVGTGGDGLHLMDRKAGSFQRLTYDPKHPEKLSRPPLSKNRLYDHITFITQDFSGAIWIGTLYGGLTRYDEKTGTIKHYINKDTASGFIGADEQTFGHYTSRDGILWITCLAGNIYTVSPNAVKIPYVRQGVDPYTFFLYKDSSLYMGTGTGLIKKNLKDGSVRKFPVKGFIGHIERDNRDNLWIPTEGSGLYKLDLQTETFIQYRHSNETRNSLANDSMVTVYVDRDQNVWTGTQAGLDKLDPATGIFQHFTHKPGDSTSINSKTILTLTEDRGKNIWAGHENGGGVDKMDIKTGKCQNYLAGENVVFSIIESNDGTIWIGTLTGLYKYDEEADNCTLVTNPLTGKSFPVILSITEDQQKNLWLVSGTGLIKFSPKKQEVSEFGKNAGLDPGAFIPFSGYQDNSGHLYFSDTVGYYRFYLKDIETGTKPPEIAFTAFSLGSEMVKPGPNSPIKDEIWNEKAMQLKYNQNVFSFEYNPVDYNNPQENKSLYKLENYDNDWRIATNPAKAYYFNVPPGKYIFHVKARNSLGLWTDKSIAVTITPPWWQTWWAYTLFITFFAGAIWGFIAYRSQRLRRENRILEEKVTLRTEQLNRSLLDLKATQTQLIQSEKMASLGELTAGIAHEIQNPLNFVNNFSDVNKELVDELQQELKAGKIEGAISISNDIRENEEKINHHGKRADAIVRSMLQHSRTSSGQKELIDINALCDEYLRLAYHGLRAKEKSFNAVPTAIGIRTDFDSSIGKINIVPQDIGRVMLNLINNAFYAANEKVKAQSSHLTAEFKPLVSIQTKKLNDRPDSYWVAIMVKDNGNGIPKNIVDKIFQPFFTTKPTGEGTGLGLSLSYDIIKAHGGDIKLETREGEGSEFLIELPATADME